VVFSPEVRRVLRAEWRGAGRAPSGFPRRNTFLRAEFQQQVLSADVLYAQALGPSPAIFKIRLHSALSGTSTEVEMRSRMVMRLRFLCEWIRWTLLAQEAIGQSFIFAHQADSRCSVSMYGLPYWLARISQENDASRFLCIPFKHD